jgi:hypothetical protein
MLINNTNIYNVIIQIYKMLINNTYVMLILRISL